ncbi:hypothetical protein B0H10DRAFT_1954221 [Mycena sp. CBHHK59/15]|nr:hypothetical protein B0H10DRAFT_1954221 [Mycena sp. CBHHK59/15]
MAYSAKHLCFVDGGHKFTRMRSSDFARNRGGMPDLADVTDASGTESDDTDDESGTIRVDHGPIVADTSPSRRVATAPTPKGKITAYWKVETPEEKVGRLEREVRVYAEGSEERQLWEVDETRKRMAHERIMANGRMQRHCDRRHDEKIADG